MTPEEKDRYAWGRYNHSINRRVAREFAETCRLKGVKVSPEIERLMEMSNLRRFEREARNAK